MDVHCPGIVSPTFRRNESLLAAATDAARASAMRPEELLPSPPQCNRRLAHCDSMPDSYERQTSFTVARSNNSLRLGLLVSGLQDRVQAAQRRNSHCAVLYNRCTPLSAVWPRAAVSVEWPETLPHSGRGVSLHRGVSGSKHHVVTFFSCTAV